jgi:hypothetical protein
MKEHEDNRLSRRQFLLASALAGGGLMLPTSAVAQNSMPMASTTATPPIKSGPADVTLRIGPVLVDVTKDKTLSTIGYNGQVPGSPCFTAIRISTWISVSCASLNTFKPLPRRLVAAHEIRP